MGNSFCNKQQSNGQEFNTDYVLETIKKINIFEEEIVKINEELHSMGALNRNCPNDISNNPRVKQLKERLFALNTAIEFELLSNDLFYTDEIH